MTVALEDRPITTSPVREAASEYKVQNMKERLAQLRMRAAEARYRIALTQIALRGAKGVSVHSSQPPS